MENLRRLSKSSYFLLIVAMKIAKHYGVGTINNMHILMAIAYLKGPLKDYLNENNITFEHIEETFFKEDKKFGEFNLTDFHIKEVERIELSYETLTCIEGAMKRADELDEFVFPEDILFEIIKRDDNDVMVILDENVEDLHDFTEKLLTKELSKRRKINNNNIKRKKVDNKCENLNKYGINLVEEAMFGNIDPVSGRDKEINRMIEILGRKTKSNPCLVGEAGVGKTAIVEGLALQIANGTVPDFLKGSAIYSIDIGSLLAGTKYRGELESRLECIIEEAKIDKKIILFFDEIHNMINAGGAEGSADIANILKPCLARGSVKCIGATTRNEYRKNIEKDSAFERRFQKISVEEPTLEKCVALIEKAKPTYEKHHGITIPKQTVKAAVELSERYITDRYLPDKAFDLIDEACSKIKIKTNRTELEKKDIIDVLYNWTGIPAEELSMEGSKKALMLSENLRHNVIGQEHAVESVSRAIMRSHAGLRDSSKPIASFIFSGPTGVGKTELARCLSKLLFDTDKNLIRIDMSEYMEKISVSKLIGSSPGYVGYKEGGQLTEAVRKRPYSVVLIDEIEKAHPEVLNIFLQILDNGKATDGLGKTIDFRNTIMIFTSNLYNPYTGNKKIGFPGKKDNIEKEKDYHKEAIKKFSTAFSPEFVNRFDDIVIFNKLEEDDMIKILDLLTLSLKKTLNKKGIKLTLTKKTKQFLLQKCDFSTMGARPLKRVLSKEVEDNLSIMLLKGELKEGQTVKVTCVKGELNFKVEETIAKKEPVLEVQ